MATIKNEETGLLNENELISLLTIYYNNISTIDNMFSTYMTVFLSGIFVVLGACVIGITSNLTIGTETVLVCAGTSLAIILSIGFKKMTKRSIRHALENIAKVVIVEEKLGLDNIDVYKSKHWKANSLVIKYHDETRKGTGTVENFIEVMETKGQYKNIKFISNWILGLAVSVFVFEVIKLVYSLIIQRF